MQSDSSSIVRLIERGRDVPELFPCYPEIYPPLPPQLPDLI